MSVGKDIAKRREALGLSQNELARRAGINHPTLYKIESGQTRDPRISVALKIALALGTTVEAIFGRQDATRERAGPTLDSLQRQIDDLKRTMDALRKQQKPPRRRT